MRNGIRTGVTVVAVLALLVVALKGVMYLRVKATVDDMIAKAEGVEITYDGIGTSFSGAAEVEGIRIHAPTIDQDIFVDKVRFASDDRLALITGGDWGQPGEPPPEQMRVNVIGLNAALNAELIEVLERQAAASGQPRTAACEGGFNLDPQLLMDMGFEQIAMDMEFEYRFDRYAEQLLVEMGFDMHEVQSVQMRMTLDGMLPEDVGTPNPARIGLDDVDMHIRVPRAFGDRYMKQCAKRHQATVDAYREKMLGDMHNELRKLGISLGAGLRDAISSFYTDWGDIQVRMQPAEPLGMMNMMSLTPGNAVDVLGVSLFVNGQAVPDLQFAFDPQQFTQLQRQLSGQPASNIPSPELPRRVRIVRKYEAVPVAMLNELIGEEVRVKPLGQPLREGVLVAVVQGEAVIEQRTYGGSFTAYVHRDNIEHLEVERVERTPLD